MSVAEAEAREIAVEAPSGLWHEAFERVRRNPGAIVGFVARPDLRRGRGLRPVDRAAQPPRAGPRRPSQRREPPSAAHPFGLDHLGRDQFSRVVYGARYSLLIGVVSVAVGLSSG